MHQSQLPDLTMVRRNKVALRLLLAVLLLLAYVLYRNGHSLVPAAVAVKDQEFAPLAVESPALRLDLLEQLKAFQYQGPQRNIFSIVLPPPPPPVAATPVIPAEPVPAPPPPMVIPASLLGFVTDPSTGIHRALLGAGDDVYVLGIGEVVLSRFRLVQIGSSTVEMEEISSRRRATLTLVENPGTP